MQNTDKLLTMIYDMATEGDLRAAKLYLDYSLRVNPEDSTGLTVDEALALIAEFNRAEEEEARLATESLRRD